MSNSYFTPTSVPATSSRGVSANIRSEIVAVEAGFDKLPTPAQLWGYSGNYAVAGGSTDAWTASIATAYLTSYVDGMQIRVKFAAANTVTAPTINLNTQGNKVIATETGGALGVGDIAAGMIATLTYNSTSGKFHMTATAVANGAAAAASASAAASSASAASASAAAAAVSAAASATSATASEASRDAIDNRIYPGTYSSPPSQRPDGTSIQAGDEYFGTDGLIRRYISGSWVTPTVDMTELAGTGAAQGASRIGYSGYSGLTAADALKMREHLFQAPASGYRKVYDKQSYASTTTTNVVLNSDFNSSAAGVVVLPTSESAGSAVPYWKATNMPTSGATFLATQAELVDLSGKRYLKIDHSQPGVSSTQGLITQTLHIPKHLIGKDVEVSFLTAGLMGRLIIGSTYFLQLRLYLDPASPKRLSFILPAEENTSESLTVNFERLPDSMLSSGYYWLIGEVRAAEATCTIASTNLGIPATGNNFQLHRVEADFDKQQIARMLARTRETGGMLRVWINANRTTFSNFTGGGVWQSLNTSGAGLQQLDTFVEMARLACVQLILVMLTNSDNGGDQLDDATKGAAFASCAGAVADRYKGYANVFAYELTNEGYAQWALNVAGKSTLQTALSYENWRTRFQRAGYLAIKAADPSAQVILTCGYSTGFSPFGYDTLIAPDEIADMVGYSLYIGQHTLASTASASPTENQVSTSNGRLVLSPRLTEGLEAGVIVRVDAASGGALGSALSANTDYYVVNVSTTAAGTEFYLSTTLGGAAIASFPGMSGSIYLSDKTGEFVELARDVYKKVAHSQRLPMIASEIGASNNVSIDGTIIYRHPATVAKYIRKYGEVLYDYGFSSLLAWNEWPTYEMFFDTEATALTEPGRALADISMWPKGRADWFMQELERRITATVQRIKSQLFVGDLYEAIAQEGMIGVENQLRIGASGDPAGTNKANAVLAKSSDDFMNFFFYAAAVLKARMFFSASGGQLSLLAATVLSLHYGTDAGQDERVTIGASGVKISGDSGTGTVSGSVIKGIYATNVSTASVGLSGSVGAQATITSGVITVTGARTGASVVQVTPQSALPDGIILQGRVSATNQVTVSAHNITAGSVAVGTLNIEIKVTNF